MATLMVLIRHLGALGELLRAAKCKEPCTPGALTASFSNAYRKGAESQAILSCRLHSLSSLPEDTRQQRVSLEQQRKRVRVHSHLRMACFFAETTFCTCPKEK